MLSKFIDNSESLSLSSFFVSFVGGIGEEAWSCDPSNGFGLCTEEQSSLELRSEFENEEPKDVKKLEWN